MSIILFINFFLMTTKNEKIIKTKTLKADWVKTTKTAATKKAPVKKTATKAEATKTAATKKAPVKKTATKAEATKTAATKKAPVKKTATKAEATKVVATKTPVKKATAKTETTKTPVATKKVAVKKSTTKTTAVKIQSEKNTVSTKKSFSSFFNFSFIKNSFLDVSLLYRNLLSWNISKILIFSYSVVLWFLSTLPFILIFFIYTLFNDTSFLSILNIFFTWELTSNFFLNIIYSLIVFTFVVMFSYSNIMLMKVKKTYFKWEKIEYKDKDKEYLNYKKIVRYFVLSILNILILLVPVAIFIALMWILYFVAGWFENIQLLLASWFNNYFSITSLLLFTITSVSLIYLSYRIIFSYLILSEETIKSDKTCVVSYIKESFLKTKWIKNFLKFWLLITIFTVILVPLGLVWNSLEINWIY